MRALGGTQVGWVTVIADITVSSDSPSTSTTDSAIDSDPDWSQFETVFRESKTGGCQLQKPSDR